MRATRSGRYLAQSPRGAGGTAPHNETGGRHLKQGGAGPATLVAGTPSPTMSSRSSPSPGDDCDVELLSSLELAQLLGQDGNDQSWDGQLHEEMWKDDRSASLPVPDELPFAELLQQLVSYEKVEDKGSSSLVNGASDRLNGKDRSCRLNGRYEVAKSNKNAMAARLNRLRKKEYVMGLELKVSRLSSENLELKEENQQLGKRVQDLEEETKYLKAVLANESVLSQLLGRLTGVKGMKLATSLFRENGEEMDHDYALPRKRVKVEEQESTSGGVCLHVDKEKVSVEFCSSCARNACSTVKM